jgi:hypothetical protein
MRPGVISGKQDAIVSPLIQLAPGCIAKPGILQGFAALQDNITDMELLEIHLQNNFK